MDVTHNFQTEFKVQENTSEDLYIFKIPSCVLPRLMKGDEISLHKYARGYLRSDREIWTIQVVENPAFSVNWCDHVRPSEFAYDGDSVFVIQTVQVKVLTHKWV